MNYTIREYALHKGLTIHQIFVRSWRAHFNQTPDYARITQDVDTYLNYSAIPPYVMAFMHDKKMVNKTKYFNPYWMEMA